MARPRVPKLAIAQLARALKAIVHCNHAPLMTWEDFENQIRSGLTEHCGEEDLDEFLSWFEMQPMMESLEEQGNGYVKRRGSATLSKCR